MPASAVVPGQQGSVVFVAGDSNTASVRPVRVRRTSDTIAVLDEGIEPGTKVITDGQVRLSDGSRIAPRPTEDEAGK